MLSGASATDAARRHAVELLERAPSSRPEL
jgi:hypothetical protein